MQRILELMAEDHTDDASMDFDYVLVAGHFLMRDENIFTYFEGQGVKIDHQSKALRRSTTSTFMPKFVRSTVNA